MSGIQHLLDGYARFRSGAYPAQRARFEELLDGQRPRTMVIGCSDSRVDPATIFDTGPGEIFIVRNVANLVPPFEPDDRRHGVSAALEFAVTQLEVENIVVLGHGRCGGVQAALTRRFDGRAPGEGGFIANWINLLDDARDRVLARHDGALGRAAERDLEFEAVKVSIANLRTFPCIPEREADGRLRIFGAVFAISDGVLHLLDEATGSFAPVG
jgi:carbonic anhydrase